MNLFAQITKVDAVQGLVYGRMTQEVPDNSGEILDYEKSKPNFQKWSQEFSDATGGASVGNVRAMHGKVAAGLLKEINYLDDEKAIDVVAKIVDTNELEKCKEGVYTGFSIGGSYGDKWQDGLNKRYVAIPKEVSLVDTPCLKTARFSLIKGEGIHEEKEFKPIAPIAQTNLELEKTAKRDDVKPEAGKEKYGNVKFADEKNKKYPIDTEAHVRAAWNYINKPKNADKYSAEDVTAIKAKIVAAWKDKVDKKGPPAAKAEKGDKVEELQKAEAELKLKKYAMEEINDVDCAIDALRTIGYLFLKESQETETDQAKMLSTCIENLKNFIAAEIMESDDSEDAVMLMAEKIGDLAKAGARNSKSDLEKIQTIHDHANTLGANCKAEKMVVGDDLQKIEAAKTEALAKVDELSKGFEGLWKQCLEKDELIKKLEAQPEAAKGALKSVAVSKVDDTKGEIKKDEEPKTAADALRKVFASGGVPLEKF